MQALLCIITQDLILIDNYVYPVLHLSFLKKIFFNV